MSRTISTEPAVYGSYSLFPTKYTFVILRQDFDHHKRTVAFVDSPAQWDRFVAALEAGADEVAAVHAVDRTAMKAEIAGRLSEDDD